MILTWPHVVGAHQPQKTSIFRWIYFVWLYRPNVAFQRKVYLTKVVRGIGFYKKSLISHLYSNFENYRNLRIQIIVVPVFQNAQGWLMASHRFCDSEYKYQQLKTKLTKEDFGRLWKKKILKKLWPTLVWEGCPLEYCSRVYEDSKNKGQPKKAWNFHFSLVRPD